MSRKQSQPTPSAACPSATFCPQVVVGAQHTEDLIQIYMYIFDAASQELAPWLPLAYDLTFCNETLASIHPVEKQALLVEEILLLYGDRAYEEYSLYGDAGCFALVSSCLGM